MNIKPTKIFRSIIKRDPIFITLIYIGFVWLILIIIIYAGTAGMRKHYPVASFFASIIITAIPIVITFHHITSYRKTLSSFMRLFSLLVQIVLLFGTIYFIEQTLSVSKDIKESNYTDIKNNNLPFSNIDNSWYYRVVNNHPNKLETLYYALLSYQDCIHFSLVTSSTVGYGDIFPKDPIAKLLVDIQIVLSFIIAAFGIGSFISIKSKSSPGKKLLETAEHIENNLPEARNSKLQEWEKYCDFMSQKFINLKKLVNDEQDKRGE